MRFLSKHFSTSSCWFGSHYDTLSVPQNATRGQIKSSFYKLSKRYHPDVAQDEKAKEKFHAISEAYEILGDDRQRRTYDRSLVEKFSSPRHLYPNYGASYETRRNRGATHAWENHRPGYYHKQCPPSPPPPRGNAHPHYYQRPPDSFSSPNVQRATGRRPFQDHMSDADGVSSVSSFWRAVQVFGVVVLVASFGGGYSANA